MKVVNKTVYRTADLKKLFHEAARQSPIPLASGTKRLTVEVVYSRCGDITGHAYYNKVFHKHGCGYLMRVKVPKTVWGSNFKRAPFVFTQHCRRRLAYVFIHEMYHCAGIRHNEMRGGYFHGGERDGYERMSWADGYEIRRQEIKPKPTAQEKREAKLTHARKMLRKHETDLKRKQNLVKKWRKKVKYHEKRNERHAAPS